MKTLSGSLVLVALLLAGCTAPSEYQAPSGLRSAAPEKTFGGGLSGDSITDSEWEKVTNTTLNSVVKIEVETCDGSGSGSGFRLGNWIVTNRHVVDDAVKVEIQTLDEKYLEITNWRIATEDDIAFLELPPSALLPLSISSKDATPGDLVALVGFPLGGEQDVRRGRIFEIEDPRDNESKSFVFSVTAEALPGDSGGPAINVNGKVIGVTYAIDLLKSKALVVPVSRVSALLRNNPPLATPIRCD